MARRVAPPILTRIDLHFTRQDQENNFWCWAAVGSSCVMFYKPTSNLNQCKIAGDSLSADGVILNCCLSPRPTGCLVFYFLVDQTNTRGSFVTAKINGPYQAGFVSINTVKTQIDGNKLLAFLVYTVGVRHFVTISGYETDGTNITAVKVDDPYTGTRWMAYSQFTLDFAAPDTAPGPNYTFFSHPPTI